MCEAPLFVHWLVAGGWCGCRGDVVYPLSSALQQLTAETARPAPVSCCIHPPQPHISDNFICFEVQVQVTYLVRYNIIRSYLDKSMSKMFEWFLQRQSSTYLEVDITCLNGLNANLPACITDDLWTI